MRKELYMALFMVVLFLIFVTDNIWKESLQMIKSGGFSPNLSLFYWLMFCDLEIWQFSGAPASQVLFPLHALRSSSKTPVTTVRYSASISTIYLRQSKLTLIHKRNREKKYSSKNYIGFCTQTIRIFVTVQYWDPNF